MIKARLLSRICMLTNYNQYESKRHFAEKFAAALQRQGVDILTFDTHETPVDGGIVDSILRFSPDLTCSFNTIMPLSNGQYLWDKLRLPHWSILVDPAIYNVDLAKSPYSVVSCVDRGDCQALAKTTSDRIFFFPHAVEKDLTPDKHKDLDVVFFGSCYDYEGLRASWREQQNDKVNLLLDDAIEIVLSDGSTSIAEALVKAWNRSQLSPEGVDFYTLFYYVDYYTRGKERVELIRAMKGMRVHVFGETSKEMGLNKLGWEHYLSESKHVSLYPAVPFPEMIQLLRRSKISLNSMPFFKDGSHERVFMALLAGALPITAQNLYWEEQFVDQQEIALYSPGNWESAAELVRLYLSNEPLRKQIVAAGAAKAVQEHTWDARADWVVKHLPRLLERIGS